MNPPSFARPATAPVARGRVWLAVAILVLGPVAAYHNSFSGPFVFDDPPSITENVSIRRLWPPGPLFSPPPGAGVGGRPVANLTFALNYALGGENVRGYHVGNLLVHTLAALALFGLVRRTLLLPALRERFGSAAAALALAVAGLWALHPLQTATVDYVSQRTEALMGLCYLLTLYAFVRGVAASASRVWPVLAVVACALGMASKEVMVTAPLLVLLHDRTFVAGSFSAAWRSRWKFYLSLAATWGLLGYLLVGLENRGVGFGFALPWWDYAAAGACAVVTYLRLAWWPHPLVFDYGPNVVDGLALAPFIVAVAVLVTITAFALWRAPRLGFLGAWFFVLLAPTSSVVPIVRQSVAENRVYLPLVAVVAGAVFGVYLAFGRRSLIACAALAVGCGLLTVRRNDDYRSALALWGDTVEKRPNNWRAHNSLAAALGQAGRPAEAVAHYEISLHIQPTLPETHNNLAIVLEQLGRYPAALAHYEITLLAEPWRADTQTNFANALCKSGRPADAIPSYEAALRLKPDLAEAHIGLGNALVMTGRPADAEARYEAALRLAPHSLDAHQNLAFVLASSGRAAEARPHYEAVLRLSPDHAPAREALARLPVAAPPQE